MWNRSTWNLTPKWTFRRNPDTAGVTVGAGLGLDEADVPARSLGRAERQTEFRGTCPSTGDVVGRLGYDQGAADPEERCSALGRHGRGAEAPGNDHVKHPPEQGLPPGLLRSSVLNVHPVAESKVSNGILQKPSPPGVGIQQDPLAPGPLLG
jgi:hypothetical protein